MKYSDKVRQNLKKLFISLAITTTPIASAQAPQAPEKTDNPDSPTIEQTISDKMEDFEKEIINEINSPNPFYDFRTGVYNKIHNITPTQEEQALLDKINQPVSPENRIYEASIGKWRASDFKGYQTTLDKAKELRKTAQQIKKNCTNNTNIQPTTIKEIMPNHKIRKDTIRSDATALYRHSTDEIIMGEIDISEANTPWYRPTTKEYIKGNVYAQLSILYHEVTHRTHAVLDGYDDAPLSIDNRHKGNRLTETVANAVQYLAAAEQYTYLKKNGVDSIQVNGEKRPAEDILEMFVNWNNTTYNKDGSINTTETKLKDYVTKNGFDVNNPQCIRDIVAMSSEAWHAKFISIYNEQGYSNARGYSYNNTPSSFTELRYYYKQQDKLYDNIAQNMLKDVFIGNNTFVDLTHCRDLLDTMTNKDVYELENFEQEHTTGILIPLAYEVETIDNHLESLGLTTDKQKTDYMTDFFEKFSNRIYHNDVTLTNILLTQAAELGACYTDGIEISKNDNVYVFEDIFEGNGVKVTISSLPQLNQDMASITPAKIIAENTK